MRQSVQTKGGLEEGWGSPKSKLLDDLVSKLSQAAIKPRQMLIKANYSS